MISYRQKTAPCPTLLKPVNTFRDRQEGGTHGCVKYSPAQQRAIHARCGPTRDLAASIIQRQLGLPIRLPQEYRYAENTGLKHRKRPSARL